MERYQYRGRIWKLKATHPNSVDVGIGEDVVAVPLKDFNKQVLEVGYVGTTPYKKKAWIARPEWVGVGESQQKDF